jgi:hypothetical protein
LERKILSAGTLSVHIQAATQSYGKNKGSVVFNGSQVTKKGGRLSIEPVIDMTAADESDSVQFEEESDSGSASASADSSSEGEPNDDDEC